MVIRASNSRFGTDPAPNTVKQLSIAYACRLPDRSLDYRVQVVGEDDSIIIPLQTPTIPVELTIHAAHWADLDLTEVTVVRSRVLPNQTLQFHVTAIHSFDPWYNVLKTISIIQTALSSNTD